MVSLIVDGKRETIGPSPAKTKLDPRKSYQVLFEKPGFVSINRPIVFTGTNIEKIAVNLERAGSTAEPLVVGDAKKEPKLPKTEKVEKTDRPEKSDKTEKSEKSDKTVAKTEPKAEEKKAEPKVEDKKVEPKVDSAPASGKGTGTLLLGSKPPCDIFIDGKETGLQTPQRDIKLNAGKHKITLVNNEFGIKETFVVEIKADTVEKQIKDYSDRIPK
jgi:hypothetical protein